MKVFKLNLSVIYNDDDITEDEICENLFHAMHKINNKISILNIDDIKEVIRPNKIVKKMIDDIVKSSVEDVKSNNIEEKNYLEINKKNIEKKRNKKNENKN